MNVSDYKSSVESRIKPKERFSSLHDAVINHRIPSKSSSLVQEI
jgi:hypothetical protein